MYNYKFLILSSIFVFFFPPFFSSTRIVLITWVVVVVVDSIELIKSVIVTFVIISAVFTYFQLSF